MTTMLISSWFPFAMVLSENIFPFMLISRCTFMCMCACACMSAWMPGCVCICVCVCVYVALYVCLYVCLCLCVHTNVTIRGHSCVLCPNPSTISNPRSFFDDLGLYIGIYMRRLSLYSEAYFERMLVCFFRKTNIFRKKHFFFKLNIFQTKYWSLEIIFGIATFFF